MALIASNGVGGGVYSAGASWAGGVAPGLGDEAQVLAGDTITIDAGFTVGNDNPGVPAMDVLNGGTLDWDGLGVDTCTFRGDFYDRIGGTLTLDGTATLANVLTIKLNDSAALVKNKYRLYLYGTATITGFNKTRIEDDLSADAAAAQPDIITDNNNSVNWRAGDEIWLVSPTTTATEIRTIQNIVGATVTFTVNLANTFPTDSYAINLTRNIIITVSSTAHPCAIMLDGGDLDVDWATLYYLGNTWGWGGIQAQNNGETLVMDYSVMRECVEYSIGGRNILSSVSLTYDIFYGHQGWYSAFSYEDLDVSHCYIKKDGGAGSSMGVEIADGSSLTDSFVWGDRGVRVTGSGWTVSDCVVWRSSIYGLWLYAAYAGILQDNQYRRCTGSAIYIDGAAGVTDTNSIFANNTTDIYIAGFADMFFVTCNTISTITKVVDMSLAAKVRFYNCGGVTTLHKAHLWAGSYEMQGAVKRTGTYAMLMSSSSATDALIAESTVPAINGTQVAVTAYFRKNAAYGAANLPFLRLSGAGVTTSTSTMANVDDTWVLLTVSGTPTRDGFCKVEFVCQSAGVGAAVYVDDVLMIYTAIDTGSFDYWFEGDVAPVMMATGLGALDIWAALDASLTVPNSIGLRLVTNVDQSLSTTESNIRGADSDDLKDISDEIATVDTNVDAILLDTGTSGVAISVTVQQAIADEILKRGAASVEDTADATSLGALVLAAFESVISGATWTIYKTDHATTFTTRTVTTSGIAQPIVEVT